MESEELFRRIEWAAAYQNTEEYPEGYWLDSPGDIPAELEGTYFRNGPGLFSHGTDRVVHPFDGHGLVATIAFSQGRAFFRSRYVQTTEYREETAAGRILYKGTFGTKAPGGLLKNLFQIAPRNVANTGILSTGHKCLALFEAGQPYCLDPTTLETRGLDLLGGHITSGSPFSTGLQLLDKLIGFLLMLLSIANNLPGTDRVGGEAVCAHPVTDPESGNHVLFSFCLQLGFVTWNFLLFGWKLTLWLPGLVTRLKIREFNEALEQLSVLQVTLPGYCFLHDLGITASHYVIFQNPVSLRMLPLLLGSLCPVHCIRWTGVPPKIHILSRPTTSGSSAAAVVPHSEKKGQHSSTSVQLLATAGSVLGVSGTPARPQFREQTGMQEHTTRSSLSLRSRGSNVEHSLRDGQCLEQAVLASESQAVTVASIPEELAQALSSAAEDSSAVDRSAGQQTISGQDATFVFHQANAYESEGGQRVIVDCIRYPSMPDFEQASGSGKTFEEVVDPDSQPISQLWRFQVDKASGRTSSWPLSCRAMEFPAVNPDFIGRKHRYVYTAAALHPTLNRPQQALVKLDTDTQETVIWRKDVHYYVGEPSFVPLPAGKSEDEGWLLSICYDASLHTSEFIILNAQTMKLQALLPLKHVLPHGLHGGWSSTCYLSEDCL